MGIWSYSGTASANTLIDGINAGEGMSPANLNNIDRALAAAMKNYAMDTGGALTAGGTAAALTVTTAGVPTSYFDGLEIAFVASLANIGAASLNANGLGAKQIRKVISGAGDVPLGVGDIRANGHYTVRYDASANSGGGAWILLDVSRVLTYSGAYNPAFVYSGFSTSTTVTVTGAEVGDACHASHSGATDEGCILYAFVTAADSVKVVVANVSGSASDPASATLHVRVIK